VENFSNLNTICSPADIQTVKVQWGMSAVTAVHLLWFSVDSAFHISSVKEFTGKWCGLCGHGLLVHFLHSLD